MGKQTAEQKAYILTTHSETARKPGDNPIGLASKPLKAVIEFEVYPASNPVPF